MSFTGRTIGWVATRSPGRGRAKVYVDGTIVATIDLYAATRQPRRLVFVRDLTPGSHSIVSQATAG